MLPGKGWCDVGELVRSLPDTEGPLCPSTLGGTTDPRHEATVRTLNAFYEAAAKDADGELVPPVDAAYSAAAYGTMSDRMRLYVERVGFTYQGQRVVVESWYFKCGTCGFVLPASRVEA